MFTGIVTHLGTLVARKEAVFTFSADLTFCKKIKAGTSISVNGACLTVLKRPINNTFSVGIMPETFEKTMFRELKKNDLVNLELPLSLQSFLSGHMVLGHIDCVGKIKSIKNNKESKIFIIEFPAVFNRYIVEKGSIAVNGVSLTVINIGKDYFTVGIILYTWQNTTFHKLKTNSLVNIEVDILAKHLEKLSGNSL